MSYIWRGGGKFTRAAKRFIHSIGALLGGLPVDGIGSRGGGIETDAQRSPNS